MQKSVLEIDELRKQIAAEERRIGTAKTKRGVKTTACFAVAYFLFFWFLDGNPADIREFVTAVFVSIFLSIIHFGVNDAVFDHLHTKNEADRQYLEQLQKELRERMQHE